MDIQTRPRKGPRSNPGMVDNRDSLLQAFLRTKDALRRFLLRRTGSSAAADDLIQDAWLKIARDSASGGGRAIDNPQAYLFRVASNLATDLKRAESRRRLAPDEVDKLIERAAEEPGPERIAADRSEVAALARALEELPPRRRAVLLASRLEGVPHRVLAERHGVTTRTIENEIARALEHCALRLGRPLKRRFGPAPDETS